MTRYFFRLQRFYKLKFKIIHQLFRRMIKFTEIIDIPYFHQINNRLDPFIFQFLLKQCTRKIYSPQSVIFKQGQKCQNVYIIQEGEVAIYVKRPDQKATQFEVNRLSKWQVFGELNIRDPNARRTATVKSLLTTKIIIIPKQIYNQFIFSTMQIQIYQLQIPFIELLNKIQKIKFCLNAKKKSFKYNNIVYNFNDLADQLYYVINGEFQSQTPDHKFESNFSQGCIFGHVQILQNKSNRINKITCKSQGTLYSFRKQDFQLYYLQDQKVLYNFNKMIEHKKNLIENYMKSKDRIILAPKNVVTSQNILISKERIVNINNKFFQNALKQHQFIQTMKIYQTARNHSKIKSKNKLPQFWFKTENKKLQQKIKRLGKTSNHNRLLTEPIPRFDLFKTILNKKITKIQL